MIDNARNRLVMGLRLEKLRNLIGHADELVRRGWSAAHAMRLPSL